MNRARLSRVSLEPQCPVTWCIQMKLLLEKEVLGDLGQPHCEVTLEATFKGLLFFIRTVEGRREWVVVEVK